MKPAAPREYRGEFRPIATKVPGLQICEHLPQLAQRADQLAVVRSLTHGNVDHTVSTHYLLTGEEPPRSKERDKQWPHIGSVLARLRQGEQTLPPFVSMRPKVPGDVPRFVEQSQGQFSGWLSDAYDPLTIDQNPADKNYRIEGLRLPKETSSARLGRRRQLLAELNQYYSVENDQLAAAKHHQQRAFDLLTAAASQQSAFDIQREPDTVRARYGLNPHGQSVLQARRLVERGVPLVTVFWPNEGIKNVSVYWDTHRRNFIDLKERLCPVTDQAFSALLDDLQERGLLDETLVVWAGEFGRTPKVGQRNSNAGAGADGRDHWAGCFSAVLAGAGVSGGAVYGASDKYAAFPARDALHPRDLVATIYHLLGVPADQILHDVGGRPHRVRPGQPLHDILG